MEVPHKMMSTKPLRFNRLIRFLNGDDSDRSIAESIGIAVAVLYGPMLALSIVGAFLTLIWGGLSAIPDMFDTYMEVQVALLTTSTFGLTAVVATFYGAGLYTIMSRRRTIVIGWIVFTTLSSFARYSEGSYAFEVGRTVGATSGGEATFMASVLALPILFVPFALDLAPKIAAKVSTPPDREPDTDPARAD